MSDFEVKPIVDTPKVLGKMDVLRAKKLKKELVPVPEWGGSVWVQEMTAEMRDRFDGWVVNRKTNSQEGMRLQVLISTVVNEDGTPMFTELDIPDLKGKSGCATTRLSDAGMRLSGMSEEAKVEETKNSAAVESGDSSSSSVETSDAHTPTTSSSI